MKKLILLMLAIFFITLVSAQPYNNTFEAETPANVYSYCLNETGSACGETIRCNMTVFYPNNSLYGMDLNMSNNVNGWFNYTMGVLDLEGTYYGIVYCFNPLGLVGASDFEFTYGDVSDYWNLSVVLGMLGISGVFAFSGFFVFAKDRWIIKNALFMCALIMGVLTINTGRVLASSSENIGTITTTGLIIAIIILLVMFLYLFILTLRSLFISLKDIKKGDEDE